MSFPPPGYGGYYYYSHIQNGTHQTIVGSNIPVDNRRSQGYTGYTGYTDGLAAQQPFPNNVRIKFSAPPSKQLKKNSKFSEKIFFILLVLIVILLFEKRSTVGNVFFSSSGWHKPEIPWKGPKEFEIDPKEFNNLEIIVSGHAAQGNLVITRSSNNTSLINIQTQILLSHESLQNRVEILPFYDLTNYTLQVKTPEFCAFPDCILTNINITFPKNLKDFGKFLINVINLNINNDDFKDITFDKINWKLNPSIHIKGLKSREISIRSSGQISGNYYIDDSLLLQTSNSLINAATTSFTNSIPKSIKIFTSNSAIQGSFPSAHLFEAHTSNGKIDLNVKSASQQNAGKTILGTSNGNICGVYDVNSEWHASTSNGNVNVELNLVNLSERRISGMASNGRIDASISDSYKGKIHLQTSNGLTTIGGSSDNINYISNTKSLKVGYKGGYNNNELSLHSSNGKIGLNFF